MSPYVFVAAAALAMIPILALFKINVEKLKQDPSLQARVQNNMMIGVAISEGLPILLIVYGFSQMESVAEISELYTPAIILLFLVIFAVFFIFLQKKVDVPEEAKAMVTQFSLISTFLVLAIPIISIVALFMMLP
ncbi:hypothetical protein KM914_09150 [Virgibacillus pantothenticus]|uniref:Uncharacterized protein n=1 Tax=Virgibacillus pantothenticus TaxID=1473 RepID=A0A0L0QSC1_VIRPA|nr:hypothetical protein [Virgibacillus pantothenticus]KNE21580.1 hypothetical protein AFK71_07985 [Virgibacillus pantothenticus]MBU8566599.1 hypothetical protein [Virgibacillus pantothenticus]MBU8599091.1 hypothetical protein [Virgibacillus pantothenticus]MBU8634756.1 hypothetical protein [Virgibacillus pantothenticus]MBU8641161.1 hypothetical protein [Virgibacillus pantothenticus]